MNSYQFKDIINYYVVESHIKEIVKIIKILYNFAKIVISSKAYLKI